MINSERKVLIQKIETVFADLSYPQEEIAPCGCDECREVTKSFVDKHWKTIQPAIAEENFGNLSLLSPSAFHFFLPAYLIYSLNHFSYHSTEVCEFTIYSLTPSKKDIKDRFDYLRERFQYFTVEQMNCIYEFLELVKSDQEFDLFWDDVDKGVRNLKDFLDPNLRQ